MGNTIRRSIEITPDPEELARCFAAMLSDDQARFFRHVAVCMGGDDYNTPMQIAYMANDLVRRAHVEHDEDAVSAIYFIHELSLDLQRQRP